MKRITLLVALFSFAIGGFTRFGRKKQPRRKTARRKRPKRVVRCRSTAKSSNAARPLATRRWSRSQRRCATPKSSQASVW